MELAPASELEKDLEKELIALRSDPSKYSTLLKARERLYKGNEVEILKDDLKTKVLLATQSGRKAVNAAVSACDKARGLKPWDFGRGLHRLAVDTCEDISKRDAMSTNVSIGTLQQYANIKSSTKTEFKADRIIIYGPDLYTAQNIVISLLINDGVPDAKARAVLLTPEPSAPSMSFATPSPPAPSLPPYRYCGVAVRKHPSHEYVVCIAVATPVYEDK